MKTSSWLVLSLLLVLPLVARAQSPEELEAFSYFKEGRTAMEAGDCVRALEWFDRAQAIFPAPQILIRKAECLDRLGRIGEALAVYQSIPQDDPKVRTRVQKAIESLKSRQANPVEVLLEADAPGAEVTVDQVATYRLPATLRLTPGIHRLEFQAQGYRTRVEDHAVPAKGPHRIAVTLERLKGQVVIATDQDSFQETIVRLDDREFAPEASPESPTRTAPLEVGAGRRRLLCVKPGHSPYATMFEVAPGQVLEVPCRLGPPLEVARSVEPAKPSVGKWVTFGLGSAALLAGAGLSGWYFGMKGSGKVARGTDYHEGWIGVGLMAAGAGAIVAAFTAFPSRPTQERSAIPLVPQAMPSVTPVPGGAAASVAFSFR